MCKHIVLGKHEGRWRQTIAFVVMPGENVCDGIVSGASLGRFQAECHGFLPNGRSGVLRGQY